MSKYAPVVGKLGPQWMGGPFRPFDNGTVHGLAVTVGDAIDVLAIVVHRPGRGDGHRFVAELQKHYRTVTIWETRSQKLRMILESSGFTSQRRAVGDSGLLEEVLAWECPR